MAQLNANATIAAALGPGRARREPEPRRHTKGRKTTPLRCALTTHSTPGDDAQPHDVRHADPRNRNIQFSSSSRLTTPQRAPLVSGAGRACVRWELDRISVRAGRVAGGSTRKPIEDLDTCRHDSPGRTIARKDRDPWMKEGRVIERSRVDRMGVVFADLSPEYKAPANRTEVTNSDVAVCGFRSELPRLAAETHRTARKTHERDESRARRLPAIRAVAMSHE
jgi:hypothetical protein